MVAGVSQIIMAILAPEAIKNPDGFAEFAASNGIPPPEPGDDPSENIGKLLAGVTSGSEQVETTAGPLIQQDERGAFNPTNLPPVPPVPAPPVSAAATEGGLPPSAVAPGPGVGGPPPGNLGQGVGELLERALASSATPGLPSGPQGPGVTIPIGAPPPAGPSAPVPPVGGGPGVGGTPSPGLGLQFAEFLQSLVAGKPGGVSAESPPASPSTGVTIPLPPPGTSAAQEPTPQEPQPILSQVPEAIARVEGGAEGPEDKDKAKAQSAFLEALRAVQTVQQNAPRFLSAPRVPNRAVGGTGSQLANLLAPGAAPPQPRTLGQLIQGG